MDEATDSLVDIHRRALEVTRRFVAGIGAEQWALDTPCEGWDVRALVNHVVSGNWWAAELAAGRSISDVGDRLDGDVLGRDPLGAYDASAEAAALVFAAAGALDAPCAVSYGPVPGSVYVGHRIIDVLIHGWDIATATGQSAALDQGLVEACWQLVEPQADLLRGSGAFGDEVTVPADADRQTQLLATLGRRSGPG